MAPALGPDMRISRVAPAVILLALLLLPPGTARADSCGETPNVGVVFCAVADDPLSFVFLAGGIFGTFLGGPSAVLAGGRNLYERDGNADWDTLGYVGGAFSLGGGAMLVGLGFTDYYNKKTDYLMPLGAVAMGVGALSLLIPLLPEATREREYDDDFGRFSLAPSIVVDRQGNAGPAFALSFGR